MGEYTKWNIVRCNERAIEQMEQQEQDVGMKCDQERSTRQGRRRCSGPRESKDEARACGDMEMVYWKMEQKRKRWPMTEVIQMRCSDSSLRHCLRGHQSLPQAATLLGRVNRLYSRDQTERRLVCLTRISAS